MTIFFSTNYNVLFCNILTTIMKVTHLKSFKMSFPFQVCLNSLIWPCPLFFKWSIKLSFVISFANIEWFWLFWHKRSIDKFIISQCPWHISMELQITIIYIKAILLFILPTHPPAYIKLMETLTSNFANVVTRNKIWNLCKWKENIKMSIYFHLLSSKQGKAGRLGDTMLFSLFIQAHVFPGKNKTRLGQKLF